MKLQTGHFLDFQIGQTVYLKTDIEQVGRIVTGISLRPNKSVIYSLSYGTSETNHYPIEMNLDRDIIKATS